MLAAASHNGPPLGAAAVTTTTITLHDGGVPADRRFQCRLTFGHRSARPRLCPFWPQWQQKQQRRRWRQQANDAGRDSGPPPRCWLVRAATGVGAACHRSLLLRVHRVGYSERRRLPQAVPALRARDAHELRCCAHSEQRHGVQRLYPPRQCTIASAVSALDETTSVGAARTLVPEYVNGGGDEGEVPPLRVGEQDHQRHPRGGGSSSRLVAGGFCGGAA